MVQAARWMRLLRRLLRLRRTCAKEKRKTTTRRNSTGIIDVLGFLPPRLRILRDRCERPPHYKSIPFNSWYSLFPCCPRRSPRAMRHPDRRLAPPPPLLLLLLPPLLRRLPPPRPPPPVTPFQKKRRTRRRKKRRTAAGRKKIPSPLRPKGRKENVTDAIHKGAHACRRLCLRLRLRRRCCRSPTTSSSPWLQPRSNNWSRRRSRVPCEVHRLSHTPTKEKPSALVLENMGTLVRALLRSRPRKENVNR